MKDYSNKTLEELVSEEEKMKSQKITAAVFIGLLTGIAIYAATNGKFFLTIVLLGASIALGYRYSENLKGIQAEIKRRNGSL